jgi:hypothetical protein
MHSVGNAAINYPNPKKPLPSTSRKTLPEQHCISRKIARRDLITVGLEFVRTRILVIRGPPHGFKVLRKRSQNADGYRITLLSVFASFVLKLYSFRLGNLSEAKVHAEQALKFAETNHEKNIEGMSWIQLGGDYWKNGKVTAP